MGTRSTLPRLFASAKWFWIRNSNSAAANCRESLYTSCFTSFGCGLEIRFEDRIWRCSKENGESVRAANWVGRLSCEKRACAAAPDLAGGPASGEITPARVFAIRLPGFIRVCAGTRNISWPRAIADAGRSGSGQHFQTRQSRYNRCRRRLCLNSCPPPWRLLWQLV